MKVRTRYGRLYVSAGGPHKDLPGDLMEVPSTLSLPVDYLLLLGSKEPADVARAVDGLMGYHAGVVGREEAQKLSRQASRWRRDGIPALFLRAARRAADGRFTPEIGTHLARVRFDAAAGEDEISDILALAAWCLDQAMRTGKFHVRNCKLCGVPFLATARAQYCHRTAPSSPSSRQEAVREALDELPDRERTVLELRYGLVGEPMSLEAIGRTLDLTHERVQQLEANALETLSMLREIAQLRYIPTCQAVGSVKDYRTRKRATKTAQKGDD